jgi:hypothetical protein
MTAHHLAQPGRLNRNNELLNEENVIAGIKQFYERMRSDDATVRETEFDAVMPDLELLKKLFGDDANLVWPRFEQGMNAMRKSTDQVKKDFDRNGAVKSVELVDMRKHADAQRFESLLKKIPTDVPVYRAVVTYEHASARVGAFVIVDNRMRFVREIESIAEFIDQTKSGAKP